MENIDLGWWLKDPDLKSDLTFKFLATGRDFQLSEHQWDYQIIPVQKVFSNFGYYNSKDPQLLPDITISKDSLSIAGQQLSDFRMSGIIRQDTATLSGFVQLL